MRVIPLNSDNFDEKIINSDTLAIVTFYADWCGPCGGFKPKLYSLAQELGDAAVVGKVDVDAEPQLSKRFDVNGVPNTVIFASGKVIHRITGNVPYDHLKATILKHVPSDRNIGLRQSPAPETKEEKASVLSSLLKTLRNGLKSVFSLFRKNK
ncbi:MAG: hypothetical protein K2Y22_05985 [Candidatus Obscuribacterales bacterium]|nr:hypothetical protein [Candidatus Obscuribacterales bacterium]